MNPLDSFRHLPSNPIPIRALSPNHADEGSRDYFERVIEAAVKYGYNQIHVANNRFEDRVDQFCRYKAFPGLEELVDSNVDKPSALHTEDDRRGQKRGPMVEKRIELFRWFTDLAAAEGIEVFVWHREVGYPVELAELCPEGFIPGVTHDFPGDREGPKPDVNHPLIWDFITAKLEEAYENLPNLTGVVMTMQESNIPIYHLADDHEGRTRLTRKMYDHLNGIHQRLGKKWILRTFAWREWEYAAVFDALKGFDESVPIEIKDVPMDWHLFYPHNRLLEKLRHRQTIVEMDPGAQYWGYGEVPCVIPGYFADNLRFAIEKGCQGVVARTDRAAYHSFDRPSEINLAVVGGIANNPSADPKELADDWIKDTYGAENAAIVAEIFKLAGQACHEIFFADGQYFCSTSGGVPIIGSCNTFVAERHWIFEPDSDRIFDELALTDMRLKKIDALLESLRQQTGVDIPDDLPACAGREIDRGVDPIIELFRQCRNLAWFKDFFNGAKMFCHRLRQQVYLRSPEAKKATLDAIDAVAKVYDKHPLLVNPKFDAVADMRKVAATIAERGIIDARHFSEGAAFKGRSYAIPFPEPLTADLAVKTDEEGDNILVVFAGTHMCRLVKAVVTVNGREFNIERGTMAWFWAYDGYKRAEIKLPKELCADGVIKVSVKSDDWREAPFIPEIRTEFEFPGYNPHRD